MTPEQIEIHRKRFESLCDSSYAGKYTNGKYHCSFMQVRWDGYLLCAENMPEIELPSAALFYTADIVYLDELVEKLESQGYTVKPR